MTVQEYISQKFGTFGIQLSSADLLDIWSDEEDFTDANKTDVQIALVNFIPELLLRPSISENGISFSYDVDGLRAYYSFKCSQLGLEDKLNLKPRITFL